MVTLELKCILIFILSMFEMCRLDVPDLAFEVNSFTIDSCYPISPTCSQLMDLISAAE